MPVLNDTLFVSKKGGMWGKLCKEEERKERVYHGVGYDMPTTTVTLNYVSFDVQSARDSEKNTSKICSPLRQLN